jgi:teichuronic acid exporter
VEGLKAQAASAVKWTGAGTLVRQAFQFGVSIVLARLLTPEDFGVVAVLLILTVIGSSLADGGFGQALIQAKDASPRANFSVFLLNTILAGIFAIALYSSGGSVAAFFDMPQVAQLVPIFSFSIFVSGIGAVPGALLARQLRFKEIAIINLLGAVLSGGVAISMALGGFGVWSLAAQNLIFSLVSTAGFWLRNSFGFELRVSTAALRQLGSFGVFVASANILETVLGRINAICIGKFYNAADLGYYARAESTQALPSATLSGVVNQVAFPLFASIRGDSSRLRDVFQRVSGITYYLHLPIMAGLALVADPLVMTLFGVKWAASIPLLQAFGVAGLPWLPRVVNCSFLKAIGQPRSVFFIEVWQKLLSLAVLLLTIKVSVLALVVGQAVVALATFLVSAGYIKRASGISWRNQLSLSIKPVLSTLAMAAAVECVRLFSPASPVQYLVAAVSAGACAYFLASFLLNSVEQRVVLQLSGQMIAQSANKFMK